MEAFRAFNNSTKETMLNEIKSRKFWVCLDLTMRWIILDIREPLEWGNAINICVDHIFILGDTILSLLILDTGTMYVGYISM